MQEIQKYKLALVVTYFGKIPAYFRYFLQSCSYNTTIDFIIFTDANYSCYQQYGNVVFIPSNLKKINELASGKFGFPVNIKSAYKLCDLKPMYGLIYEDYLRQYSHWGYCDIDIIFGNLKKCITPYLLHKYDIISSHSQYMSGAFSIYRNTQEVSDLCRKSKDFKKVLLEDTVFFFDEASNVIDKLWSGYKIFDFTSKIESISHVIANTSKHNLSIIYKNIITEKIQNKVTWENGQLMDRGSELFIFHFLIYKSSIYFHTSYFINKQRYVFTRYGIFIDSIRSYTISWLSSVLRNVIRKSIRKLIYFVKY